MNRAKDLFALCLVAALLAVLAFGVPTLCAVMFARTL